MTLDGLARATQENETDPQALAWRETQESLYGGDGYIRSVPSSEQLADFTAISALDLYRSRFSGADGMVVAVVGDSDYEMVLDVAKRYIGTLPAGNHETWVDRTSSPAAEVDRRTVSAGVNDASAGFSLLFPPVTPVTEDFRASTTVLQEVLENRLTNSLRKELGISYGGGWVELWHVDRPEQIVSVFLSVDTNADSIQLAYNRVLSEISNLVEQGPGAEELEIAKETILRELDYVDNVEKLERLTAWLLTDGQDSATLSDRYWAVDRVGALDVAEAARRLLPDGQRIEVFRE
jgi:predicted Zn-dependent peptidase